MKRKNEIFSFILVFALLLFGCAYSQEDISSTRSSSQVDYESAELFEEALNSGTDVNGKIVVFEVVKYVPDSALGINCWAGEHLNFISSKELTVKPGDKIVGRVSKKASKVLGSWKIYYEVLQILPSNNHEQEESFATEDGKIAIPESSSFYVGEQYEEVVSQIEQAGFTNISVVAKYDLYFRRDKERTVESITIGDVSEFKSGDTFDSNTQVVVTYHMHYKEDPELRTYHGVVYDRAFYLSDKDGLRAKLSCYFLFSESDHTVLYIRHSTAGRGSTKSEYGVYEGSFDDTILITWESWDFVTSLVKNSDNNKTYWVDGDKQYSEKDVESSLNEIINW